MVTRRKAIEQATELETTFSSQTEKVFIFQFEKRFSIGKSYRTTFWKVLCADSFEEALNEVKKWNIYNHKLVVSCSTRNIDYYSNTRLNVLLNTIKELKKNPYNLLRMRDKQIKLKKILDEMKEKGIILFEDNSEYLELPSQKEIEELKEELQKPKPKKLEQCVICAKSLRKRQRKYCSECARKQDREREKLRARIRYNADRFKIGDYV